MSALRVRAAIASDAPRLAANAMRAFPDARRSFDARVGRYRTGVPYPVHWYTAAERDGELVGQALTIPYRGWLGGVETTVGGLAAVAVAPEARRTGVAGALLRDHLDKLRTAGTPWSMLYPFSPRFYLAQGWSPASRRLRWRLSPRALPAGPGQRLVRRGWFSAASDLAMVQAIYEQHCRQVNGSLSRSNEILRFERGGHDTEFLVIVQNRGYLVYSLRAPEPRPQTLVVHEWVALDGEAERALLGFLAAQVDQADAILLDTPVDHALGAALANGVPAREGGPLPPEHHPLAELCSGIMARVVDLRGALAGRGYPGRSGAVAVEIAGDPLLSNNQTVVTVSVEDGAPQARAGRERGVPLVRGPVAPVSALLVGGLRLRAGLRLGLLEVDGAVDEVEALLDLPEPYPLVVF